MTSKSSFKTLITLTLVLVAVSSALFLTYLTSNRASGQPGTKPATTHNPPTSAHVQATNPLEAGKYLVLVGACNDCHTPGWMENGIKTPESDWLVGVPIG